MSFMKMASMASASVVIVLVAAMADQILPEVFFKLVMIVGLGAVTVFLGYRLAITVSHLQEKGATQQENQGIFALGLIVALMAVIEFYLIVTPNWDSRVMMAGSFIVFLVFLISRFALQTNLLKLIGISDE